MVICPRNESPCLKVWLDEYNSAGMFATHETAIRALIDLYPFIRHL